MKSIVNKLGGERLSAPSLVKRGVDGLKRGLDVPALHLIDKLSQGLPAAGNFPGVRIERDPWDDDNHSQYLRMARLDQEGRTIQTQLNIHRDRSTKDITGITRIDKAGSSNQEITRYSAGEGAPVQLGQVALDLLHIESSVAEATADA